MSVPLASGARPARTALVLTLLVLSVLAVYARVASFELVSYDDNDYVTANPWVRAGLTWEGLRWAFAQAVLSAIWHVEDGYVVDSRSLPLRLARTIDAMFGAD